MKNRTCRNCNSDFQIHPEDEKFYEQFEVPTPNQCPECRLIRRMHERNTKNLYYRTCDATGKKTLSHFHAEQPFPVYSAAAWWDDKYDATEYGIEFDFNRPFFPQFLELKNSVPHLAVFNTEATLQNSDYNNCTAYLKNCYLVAETDYAEDSYYGNLLKNVTSVVDCSICYDCELCYECVDCINCYRLRYSQDCTNCSDSYFLKNCISCRDSIGCINQRHKQYMIFNKQYTKEEYEKALAAFCLDTQEGVEALRKQCRDFFLTQPHKALVAEHNQNSLGDHLTNSKNAYYCFDSKELEDCRYCAKLSLSVKNSMDYSSWGNKLELIYFSTSCGDNCYNLKFCVNCQTNVRDSEYCYDLFSSSHCFGSTNLKKQQYCILNKKYSAKEYEKLKTRIIEHMKKTGEYGEFWPVEISPFAYNEAFVIDSFPLNKTDALSRGYRWREALDKIDSKKVEGAITCSKCSKAFKTIPQEERFYSQLGIPLPQLCSMCRHKTRAALRNPLTLWERACANCNIPIQTSYASGRPETVYCEICYLAAVY